MFKQTVVHLYHGIEQSNEEEWIINTVTQMDLKVIRLSSLIFFTKP